MIESLRTLLARPIDNAGRSRLAIVSCGVLVVVFALLMALRGDPEPRRTPAARGQVFAAPTPMPTATGDPADEPVPAEGEESDPPPRAELEAAQRTGRGFLLAYVPYLFGHRDAASLPYATDELREHLAENPPRFTEAMARRRPVARVELMQFDGTSARRIGLLAVAAAGKRRFSVRLQLGRYESGWLVTGLAA